MSKRVLVRRLTSGYYQFVIDGRPAPLVVKRVDRAPQWRLHRTTSPGFGEQIGPRHKTLRAACQAVEELAEVLLWEDL